MEKALLLLSQVVTLGMTGCMFHSIFKENENYKNRSLWVRTGILLAGSLVYMLLPVHITAIREQRDRDRDVAAGTCYSAAPADICGEKRLEIRLRTGGGTGPRSDRPVGRRGRTDDTFPDLHCRDLQEMLGVSGNRGTGDGTGLSHISCMETLDF